MAWKDSFNNLASKTKDLTEITRINLEISSYESKVKESYEKLGQYLMEHPELISTQDETVEVFRKEYEEYSEKIKTDKEKIRDIKNVDVCPNCGEEIARDVQFCPKCGQQIVHVEPAEPDKKVCPKCGADLAEGAMFCGSCGYKVVQDVVDQEQKPNESQ